MKMNRLIYLDRFKKGWMKLDDGDEVGRLDGWMKIYECVLLKNKNRFKV